MERENDRILSVSELTRRIKTVVENGFTNVTVQGEISNFKRHSSGHCYFTLKDEASQLQAVLWRGRATSLFFTPQDGMKVVVRGNITIYEIRGVYQIDVIYLQPLGVGELQLAFERLKQQLASEGLFEPGRKKPIPRYPEHIGIVTSPTGAAIRDIVNVISRRFPSVELVLFPVKVQGEGSADEIAQAIKDFNNYAQIDVMVVARGGGSLEDLWAFNEEIVARAIFNSNIPVISAVGHEIDFTIADFVADLRAPTPSAAAELVVPDRLDIIELFRNFCYTAREKIQNSVDSERSEIQSLIRSYAFNKPIDLIKRYVQHLDELERTMFRSAEHFFILKKNHLKFLQDHINSMNPDAILKRGFAIVSKDSQIVSSAKILYQNNEIAIKFHDGKVGAKIT